MKTYRLVNGGRHSRFENGRLREYTEGDLVTLSDADAARRKSIVVEVPTRELDSDMRVSSPLPQTPTEPSTPLVGTPDTDTPPAEPVEAEKADPPASVEDRPLAPPPPLRRGRAH